MELSFSPGGTAMDELTIEVGRHRYTEAYKRLTADFYLKM